MIKTFAACTAAALALFAFPAAAQDSARIAWTTFNSPAMEGNLEGNAADRGAYVITPPGYDENPDRRYPVVYFLHGYWATPQMYQDMVKWEEAVTEAAAAGNPLIVVMPDGHSKLRGGFYSSSPTTGDYETMVARDLVAFVDGSYRTLARRDSRGLAGHSMGGYGTMRIGMKHSDIFSSLYLMSACCLEPMPLTVETAKQIEGMTEEAIAKAEFGQLAGASTLVAWSPDPEGGLLKADTGLKPDGTLDPLVNYRIAANSPLVLLPQYLGALKGYEAIAIDIGDKDFLMQANLAFKAELERFAVPFTWEVYEGDHGNRIAARIRSHVLPFFGQRLDR
jgi:enterochelin esterase-like enzyme